MKLRHIGLHNFGSYADEGVCLDGVAAAVILGPNGAGKSTAVVDAVLWGLFGKCRTETDKMIRLGTDEMSVGVEFELDGQAYKVIRRRSVKTKAGKSDLELQVGQPNAWTSISGARLAETQEKICRLLNMDYDLLTSTGFLVQGQADRFSRATPSERKAILAQILQLDRYPRLKSAAMAKLNRLEGQVAAGRTALTAAEARASQAGTVRDALASIEGRMTAAAQSCEALTHAINQRTFLLSEGRILERGMEGLTRQVGDLERARQELWTRRDGLNARLVRVEKILANAGVVRDKVREAAGLDAEIGLREAEVASVQAEIEAARGRLDVIRAEVNRGLLLRVNVQTLEGQRDHQQRLYTSETGRLIHDVKRCEQSVALLDQVPCDRLLQQQCQFTKQAVEHGILADDLRAQITSRETVGFVSDLEADLLNARTTLLGWQAAGWDQQLAAEGVVELALRNRREGCATFLTIARRQREELQEFVRLVPELDQAEGQRAQIAEDIQGVDRDAGAVVLRLKDAQDALAEAVKTIGEMRTVEGEIAGLTQDRGALETLMKQWDRDRITQEVELAQCQAAAEQVTVLQGEVAVMLAEASTWRMLIGAYERIPVLILETALPLMEQEANTILGRISPSGMRIKLETQKTLKSRDGLAETLDIVVRDVFGERPYENYSGGEKFRLDVAMRIGLSKLLANRAGATLDTLVIDEGLGSLDEDGLAQLRECLAALMAEFKLILVVTHVEAMKHTFPSQILVSKDAEGSHLAVLA